MIVATSKADELLWSTERLARVIDVTGQAVRNWATQGYVRPKVWGRYRGKPHLFSTRQMYGLACIASLVASTRRCSKAYAQKVIAAFENMPDAEFQTWLGERLCEPDYAEEEMAAYVASDPEANAVFGDHGKPLLEEDREARRDMDRRCAAVDEAIRQRLAKDKGQGPGQGRSGAGGVTDDRVTKSR
jgi:hypothetical protein